MVARHAGGVDRVTGADWAPSPGRRERGLATAVAVCFALLAFLAAPRTPGFASDDGLYVAAGEGLAQGAGFTLPSRAAEYGVPLIPAGYPLIIAGFFKALGSPHAVFMALAALSAGCLAAAWLLWWTDIRRQLGSLEAALVVAVPAFSYAALAAGSTPMSDAPYALLVAAAAALWGRAPTSAARLGALAVVGALAPALRPAGGVLTVAIVLLLVSRRMWRLGLGTSVLSMFVGLGMRAISGGSRTSFLDYVAAAWGPEGTARAVLSSNATHGLWESLAAFAAPPLYYSGAIHSVVGATAAGRLTFSAITVAIGAAACAGGWRRLRAGRWAVGDLVLSGSVAVVALVPVGLLPRYLLPASPIILLWLLELAPRGWARRVMTATFGLALAGTLAQAGRFVAKASRASDARTDAYAAAGGAARRHLGTGGLVVAEFPEVLWFERGLRAVVSVPVEHTAFTEQAGLRVARRRLDTIRRGCLLDTSVYPISRALFETYLARPGAVQLPGLDGRFVRVVCWGDPAAQASTPRGGG